jgi:dynein heavy chain
VVHPLQVPPSAAAIFQHADKFRQQIGSLDLMVSLYNRLQKTMLTVERPLLAAKLDAAGGETTLAQLLL